MQGYKMKNLIYLLIIPFLFVGCDKEDERPIDNISKYIVGTWKWEGETKDVQDDEGNIYSFQEYKIYQFNADMTCTIIENRTYVDDDGKLKGREFNINGTYTIYQEERNIVISGNEQGIASVMVIDLSDLTNDKLIQYDCFECSGSEFYKIN